MSGSRKKNARTLLKYTHSEVYGEILDHRFKSDYPPGQSILYTPTQKHSPSLTNFLQHPIVSNFFLFRKLTLTFRSSIFHDSRRYFNSNIDASLIRAVRTRPQHSNIPKFTFHISTHYAFDIAYPATPLERQKTYAAAYPPSPAHLTQTHLSLSLFPQDSERDPALASTHTYISSIPYLPPCSIDTCVHVHPGRSFRRARARTLLWPPAGARRRQRECMRGQQQQRGETSSVLRPARAAVEAVLLSLSLSPSRRRRRRLRERGQACLVRASVSVCLSPYEEGERAPGDSKKRERSVGDIYTLYASSCIYSAAGDGRGEWSGVWRKEWWMENRWM